MTFDTSRRRTLLFGGNDPTQSTIFGDTWSWNGENWTQLNDIGPRARTEAALTYDVPRDRAVLFGGRDASSPFADTWEWDGEDWTQMADRGPDGRSGHAMVYDVARHRVVLFGGETAGGLRNDTWQWDGNEWSQVEDTGPDARRGHSMAFDTTRQRIVLFGGLSAAGALGDTWEWDGTSWTQMASFGPPACLAATMIHNGGRTLLFGGVSGVAGSPVVFEFTWDWDGKHWTARQDLGPGPLWGHAMAFDAPRTRAVLFGGTHGPPAPSPSAPSGETWEQFEAGPPAMGQVQLQTVEVSPQPVVEGSPIALVATLSGVPAAGSVVIFTVSDSAGNDLFGNPLEAPVQNTPVVNLSPLFLAAGSYSVSATFNSSTQSRTFDVDVHQDVRLAILTVNPATVSPPTPFDLTAILDEDTQEEIVVPLRVSINGGPEFVWSLKQLTIPVDEENGSVTIDSQVFVTGQVTWRGSLGGNSASAVVTIT